MNSASSVPNGAVGGRNETPEARSAVMRRVKSRDTTPERHVRSLLRRLGWPGYRLHRRELPGAPDVVFVGRKRAIFVHGCFWHGHTCPRGARVPQNNRAYWTAKVARNRARDAAAAEALSAAGWRVLIVWECETKRRQADIDALEIKLRDFMCEQSGRWEG